MRPPRTIVAEWLARHMVRGGMSAAASSVYLMQLAVMTAIPASLFLTLVQRLGTQNTGMLHLSGTGAVLFWVLLTVMIGWSTLLGGYAKAAFQARYVSWPWLAGLTLGLSGGFTILTVGAGASVADLHAGPTDDNAKVLAFFAIWVFSIGNALAPVGAEANDRVGAWFKTKVSL